MTAPLPSVGTVITRRRVFRQSEFDRFAVISGDDNPIHVDPEFSARTRFGRTVAHGMLLYSALWGLIQERFPGAQQIRHTMQFSAPTYAGEPMELTLEVVDYPDADEASVAVRVARADDAMVTLEGATRLRLGRGS